MAEHRQRSPIPELAGLAEIAATLGVSKQRVRELAERDETFPSPVAELSGGAVYLKTMIEEFSKHWDRRPGRPSKSQAQVQAELAHIPRDRQDPGQQTLRMVYNAIRRHDLSIDSLTPRGQTLFHAIKLAKKQEASFAPRYDQSFFQPEPPDQRYTRLHAACCPSLDDQAGAVNTPEASGMLDELRVLLTTTITMARATCTNNAWDSPAAYSPAGRELAAEEARRPPPQAGSWPWLLAPMIASWALQVAAEEARGFTAALDTDATSYAADVLCRGILETSSLAWWLLDPGIGAPARLARSLVYRLHSAGETEKAIEALELGPDDDRAGYGELAGEVRRDIVGAGLTWEWRKRNRRRVLFCGDEPWPSYTERVVSLTAHIWPQRNLPYPLLSAVAHGEMLGLHRNLVGQSPGTGLRSAPNPASALWLWQDTYLVLGALVFTACRAAAFLGLDNELAALHDWMGELDRKFPALRPGAQ